MLANHRATSSGEAPLARVGLSWLGRGRNLAPSRSGGAGAGSDLVRI